MNDSTFEENLRSLRPVVPAPTLEQRIGESLAARSPLAEEVRKHASASGVMRPTTSSGGLARWWRDLGWALAGATAALLAFAWFSRETPTSLPVQETAAGAMELAQASGAPDTFEHSAASEELVATEDATEIVETDDGLARPVRYTYLERHTWANARTGARMEIEVPREDVYLRPVSLQ